MPNELSVQRVHKFGSAKVFSASQVVLPQISYEAFTYPGDQEALSALKAIPGAAPLLTWIGSSFAEQIAHVEHNENCLRATPNCFPSLYALLVRCCEILSCPIPELYVTSDLEIGAYTSGQRRTCVVLFRGAVESLSADELSFVIGHELGHIKASHGVYRTLGSLLTEYWDAVSSLIPIPGLGVLRTPLLLGYGEWYRRSEFTCDRAGLLCVQDVDSSLRALSKLAGMVRGFEDEMNISAIIEQVEARAEVNKVVQVVSLLNNLERTHPLIPRRVKELKAFHASGAFHSILEGNYKRDALGLHEGGSRVTCRCGTVINAKLAFCPECGRAVQEKGGLDTCTNCEAVLPAGTKFCASCGAAQAEASAEAPTMMGHLRNKAASWLKQ